MRARAGTTLVLGVLASLVAAPRLVAQASGVVSGQVLEAGSDAPIDGAVVTISGPVERSVVTAADGGWRVPNVPAGRYEVTATHIAFAEEQTDVELAGAAADVDLHLATRALPLDEVVVTAGRRTQRLADVVVATELVTRADIERAGVSDLSRILTERLGIQVQGGVGAGEGVMLEGLGSERVLILLDGQPLVGRINGMVDVSRIPASSIERVEVVKGPQSSLYGSDAMGGVVNIITREPLPGPVRAGLELTAGTQGRLDGSGAIDGAVGGVTYLADVGRRTSDLTPGRAETRGALAERWDGLFKLGASPSTATTVQATLLALDERQRWQSGQLFNFSDNRQLSAQIGGSWERAGHRFAPTIHFSEFEHLSRRANSPTPVEGSGDDESQRLIEAELLYNGTWSGQAVDAGIEMKREHISSDRVAGGEETLDTLEPFAQATIPLGPTQLVPGVRVSLSDQWGTHVTPSLAASYRPAASIVVRGSVAAGYRAPSFKEMGMEFLNLSAGTGYRVRGNPDLLPETSKNVSMGVEWSTASVYVRAEAYENRFDDFIETREVADSSGVTIYTYGNIDDGFTRGVELESGFSRGSSRVVVGYAFLETGDRETGLELLGRPSHSGRLSIEQTLPWAVRASATATYTGETPIQRTADATVYRSDYLRVDLHASRSLPGGLEISVGARNVFDDLPENWPGYGGRHVYAGVRWRTH